MSDIIALDTLLELVDGLLFGGPWHPVYPLDDLELLAANSNED